MDSGLYDDTLRGNVQCPICHRTVGDGVVRHKHSFQGPLWQFHCHRCGRSFFLELTGDEIAERDRRLDDVRRSFPECTLP